MKKFSGLTLEIEGGNAAFDSEDGGAAELASIIRKLAKRIEDGEDGVFRLKDVNGNTVGSAHLEYEDDESEEEE